MSRKPATPKRATVCETLPEGFAQVNDSPHVHITDAHRAVPAIAKLRKASGDDTSNGWTGGSWDDITARMDGKVSDSPVWDMLTHALPPMHDDYATRPTRVVAGYRPHVPAAIAGATRAMMRNSELPEPSRVTRIVFYGNVNHTYRPAVLTNVYVGMMAACMSLARAGHAVTAHIGMTVLSQRHDQNSPVLLLTQDIPLAPVDARTLTAMSSPTYSRKFLVGACHHIVPNGFYSDSGLPPVRYEKGCDIIRNAFPGSDVIYLPFVCHISDYTPHELERAATTSPEAVRDWVLSQHHMGASA